MNKRILIVGVGGIGSYLVPMLAKTEQFILWIADPDIVEEKNVCCQNFDSDDIDMHKVTSMQVKYGVNGDKYEILTEMQILNYDLVVCCADNLAVRRLIYSQGFGDNCKTKWLDLRAQGRNGALISYLIDPKLSNTFLTGPDGSFSCQGEDFSKTKDKSKIHWTHVAIAGIGAQWIMRWNNGEQTHDKMVINV